MESVHEGFLTLGRGGPIISIAGKGGERSRAPFRGGEWPKREVKKWAKSKWIFAFREISGWKGRKFWRGLYKGHDFKKK